MTYFYELSNGLPDYPGEDGNFRFRYNPNSGGGQSFLQGKFKSRDGELAAPITLNGKTAILKYAPRGLGHSVTPVLLNDTNVTYTITPRGAGERNMKLEVAERTNLSDALTAFFMLPSSCGARKSADLTYSVLAKQNYWFDLVLLDCEEDPSVPTRST